MTAPPVRPRPPVEPLSGTPWLIARASLAMRRTRAFMRWWLTLGGAVTVIALLLPVADRDQAIATRSRLDALAADTLRSAARLLRFTMLATVADSQLTVAREERVRAPQPIVRPRPTDPRLPSLEEALRVARELRTPAAFLALAAEPAVRAGPRMQAVADSLATAAGRLDEFSSSDSVARDATVDEISRLGVTIVAIAQNRRNTMSGEAASPPAAGGPTFGPIADTIPFATRVAQLRDSVAQANAVHSAALAAMRAEVESADQPEVSAAALSPGLALLFLLILGVAVRFVLALSREMRSPRIAHTLEAEHAVGAPVLAIVSDPLPEGPVRFRPSGVDPFRVPYLGLTSTGTRTRTLVVTGADPVITAAVGARLAIAAAADHRATLVAELDPTEIALARIFRGPPEPGFTDAMAGAFKWREVARAVGSSDGLTITMLPAGTVRDVPPDGAALSEVLDEFTRFRNSFEFTIVIAALAALPQALRLVPGSPVVLCGAVGETQVDEFVKQGAAVQVPGVRLHGLVLWDAPRPMLPSRAELAAHLSKQKGRTPGGSFQAVRKAILSDKNDSNRPLQ
ncbi:MAG: hypothetical protein WD771_00950 [Gemmatimonadaceae bacterium]